MGIGVGVYEYAISDHHRETQLKLGDSSTQNQLVDVAEDPDKSIKVTSTTIDRLVDSGEVPVPNIVKIDIEGAEKLAMEGMKNTISNECCDLIYCEIHEEKLLNNGTNRNEIHEILDSCGFNQLSYPFNRDVLRASKTDV
jgi:uncharacterized protein (UPF0179 family)